MPRVLVVTSSYAPTMIADMQRARQLAWDLPDQGWEVDILAPGTEFQLPACLDTDSGPFFAPGTHVHTANEIAPGLFRALGMGSIGWRALVPMLVTGVRLIRRRKYDLAYFSTANFQLFLLGPLWRMMLGLPYVLDFHDPWYHDIFAPPGGAKFRVKHLLSHWLSSVMERFCVLRAAGIVSVSETYIDILRGRYSVKGAPWLQPQRQAVIPFAASQRDLALVAKEPRQDDCVEVAYVGAGGPIMQRAFGVFCRALSALRREKPEAVAGLRIGLYGTFGGWRDGMPRHLLEVAQQHGVDDLVDERPQRVSFARSLALLMRADGAFVPGIEHQGYIPSKLYSYLLSGKPLLVSMHRDSSGFRQIAANPQLGHALWFEGKDETDRTEAVRRVGSFIAEARARRIFDRRALLQEYSSSEAARRHALLFEDVRKGTATA